MTMRSDLKPDRLYLDTSRCQYFVTPDNVGVYWYDTLAEMFAAHGEAFVHHVDRLED
jgi:hypothetical protein